jgi:hypothetical protein
VNVVLRAAASEGGHVLVGRLVEGAGGSSSSSKAKKGGGGIDPCNQRVCPTMRKLVKGI